MIAMLFRISLLCHFLSLKFDNAYGLNYMRNYHPMYEEKGGIPAIEEVKFSIISNRGCLVVVISVL